MMSLDKPTREQIMSAHGRDLDAMAAEWVMGMEVARDVNGGAWIWAGHAKRHSIRTHAIDYTHCPAYSRSHNYAAVLRAELATRDWAVVARFMQELERVARINPENDFAGWHLLNTTPEQQTKAALLAVLHG